MEDLKIRVGLYTKGTPVLRKTEDGIFLENLLIGRGFHWENPIQIRLTGEIKPFIKSTVENNENEIDRYIDNHKASCDYNEVSLINILPLETYVESVVGSEMNPMAPVEFLKAHAVISRSWAVGKIFKCHDFKSIKIEIKPDRIIGWDDTGDHKGFDVCSDDHCQRYQGIQDIPANTLSAIKETANEVLLDKDGLLADTRFSKCCGGKTELFSTCWQSVDYEYLQGVTDPWCDLSGLETNTRRALLSSILKDYDLSTENYGYRWEEELSKEYIAERLSNCFGRSIGKIKEIKALHRGVSGRIDLMRISGEKGDLDIGKELWIRRLLSTSHLYSSAFEIEDLGDRIKLTGKGWGHGVGLCQIGAANMALNGYSYKEILSHYYPGTRITDLRACGFE